MQEIEDIDGQSWSRRNALRLIAAGGAAAAAAKLVPEQVTRSALDLLAATPEASDTVLLARGADGLLLSLTLVNLQVKPATLFTGPKLVLKDGALAGYLVMGLETQSVFEPAVYDNGNGAATPTPPIPALASGPSRIVLRVEAGSGALDYRLEKLLDFKALPLNVSPVADNGNGSALPLKPALTDTAIEAPFRMTLSPTSAAAFSALTVPVPRNGRTELWHARVVRKDGQPGPVAFRAIWSRDLPDGDVLNGPGWALSDETASLLPAERRDLVEATTVSNGDGPSAPAQAELMLLSPMGASLNVKGDWPTRNDIVAWRQRSSLGRDHYVKVDIPGYLMPLRFPAVKVKITDRIHQGGLAFLRKREFIVVRVPRVAYGGPKQADSGRAWPFVTAETTTLVSPPLIEESKREKLGVGEWVQLADANDQPVDLRYRVLCTDREGHTVTADLPLVFVKATDAFDPVSLQATVDEYNAVAPARRTMGFGGQRISFVAAQGEDPAMPTFDLVVQAQPATGGTAVERELAVFPKMATAGVRMEALDSVGGTQAAATLIKLSPTYVTSGFGGVANPGEVWAELVNAAKLAVPQQTGGGLAAPALDIAGLSRVHGPVRDLAEIAKNNFRPEEYFPLDSITLLGGIPLNAVLGAIPSLPDPRIPDGEYIPKVVTVRTDQYVETIVTWKPVLKSALDGLFEPATTSPDNRLELKAVFHTDLGSGQTTTRVTGDLRNFTLNFVGKGSLLFITQQVKRLRFESRDGAKPSIDVQLGESAFAGDLRFLNDLKSFLPALPGGVKIDVSPRGVHAGLNIAVPAVSLGVLLIRNLTVGIALDLPFNGDQAILYFNFSTREHPFQVTVSALGGGGFLAIGLGTRGVQQIEGSLEFGAAVAIDLGVASGSVEIMAGIYFKYAQRQLGDGQPDGETGSTLIISGYVRAVGSLSVLGLIHVSVEFYLGLTYLKETGKQGKVQGVATMTIRVEVLLFSTSVSVTMRKEFAAGPDPSFGQQITAGDWGRYCAAFATA